MLVAPVALGWPARAEVGELELAVKATYLYKLAPFVSWPGGIFSGPEEPLAICVQGQDPFGSLLDRAVAGQRVGTHAIVVRRVARLEHGSDCQIAYVGGSSTQSTAQALTATEGAPILTVTDAARGPSKGIVHLVLNGGKVRFSVNAARAEAGGMGISSKLLALATEVSR
ncbi:YfiR family protein [Phenylobacterium sp.]|uniref:YfiR family protein n=1 Tax=Phenylobacterium sp. TaxID=1871053 RepID=UPI002DEB9EA9|nr:YfiR family protein [Phenylobacterium sp.]